MTVITDHVAWFRQRWADRIAGAGDSVTIRRKTGETVNPTTGVVTPVYAEPPNPIYSGKGIWRPGVQTDTQFGEQQVELAFGTLFLPYTATGIEPDDEVVISVSADGELSSKVLVVRAVSADTYVTRRALFCEDNQGG